MKLADGESLLMKTYARACRLASAGEVLTVTNRDYYFMCGDEFAKADPEGHHQASFILEPFGRNTAPAIALAAMHVAQHYGTDACMLVLAADHLIQDPQVFADAVASARHLAANNYLVTFGIVPDAPDTGFGYIEAGEHIGCGHTVKRFVEKPDTETAITYLSAGNYFWNSGMFCFKAGHVLEELSLHAPDVLHSATQCWEAMQPQGRHNARMMEIPSAHFETVPGISIDYALWNDRPTSPLSPERSAGAISAHGRPSASSFCPTSITTAHSAMPSSSTATTSLLKAKTALLPQSVSII